MTEVLMTSRRNTGGHSSKLDTLFPGDRRDRRPGTHFAAELGRTKPPKSPPEKDAHVDEDLGCSEFGIDFPFLHRD